MHTNNNAAGPRIYNLFPTLAGSIAAWKRHLPRIAEMGFDWVFVNPFHYPGFSGSLYAVKDYYRLNPLVRGSSRRSDDELLSDFVAAAEHRGLGVMMDLVINHTSKDCTLIEEHPAWYRRAANGEPVSPSAADPEGRGEATVWGDLAELDYAPRLERAPMIEYWQALVRHYAGLGFRGFRCDAAYKVPADVWRAIAAEAKAVNPRVTFAAETLGCRPDEVLALADCGFDYLFNSVKWWDFLSPWLFEQDALYARVAPSIGFPESHDTDRLIADLRRDGIDEAGDIEAIYRQRYLFAAVFSSGIMMPVGYEYGFDRKLDVVATRPDDWQEPRFDLSAFIADVNGMKAGTPALNGDARQTPIRFQDGADGVGVLRVAAGGSVVALVNPAAEPIAASVAAASCDLAETPFKEITPGAESGRMMREVRLRPREVRVFMADVTEPVQREAASCGRAGLDLPPGLRSRPIVIENIRPELDHGRFPVQRAAGSRFDVYTTVFKEGHDRLAVVIRHRRTGDALWNETPMTLENPGLDLWHGAFPLLENGRYEYTIEAWMDSFESWRHEVEKKAEAGQDLSLELLEGRALVAEGRARAECSGDTLSRVLAEFDSSDAPRRLELLMAPELRGVMARCQERRFVTAYDYVLEVVADRPRARFAAWYEMFPRSQGRDADKSATFGDCIRRLPEIAAMGFDVVYLPPIHPIGRVHRKGPDNTLHAGPDDPGSPYAIGAAEGGHTAVHPDLGTLDDFRGFVAEAGRHGMEVALDFAIQCAPDHPWVREHPEWFTFRPDGTIKYAENPPKKYQDIVNVNFYGPHREALWTALRDVILFWAEQGVRTFRVDNPHTKPVPFWEWLIAGVRARHPDVIFLSEAFTRPPMLKMLAKVGFNQSYSYFTWRNDKRELTEYLTELTQGEAREYLMPNFFANTPDILPGFLQTGGRPAFKIRLVLAATLSTVYGIYNGFELCENAAVPDSEEYLHSEKYQYKVWDWDRSGHIKDYIAAVNWIRRENEALHEFANLRFYAVHDDAVLLYGKTTEDRGNSILVAVCLDPHNPHEADIDVPLYDFGLADGHSFDVAELLSGERHTWTGSRQRIRLTPDDPAAIYRITP